MQFIQFNIRPARLPEELLLLGRRWWPPIEFDADFGGMFCVRCALFDGLIVSHARNASWVAKIELSLGSATGTCID
jgi:hypothetical protein